MKGTHSTRHMLPGALIVCTILLGAGSMSAHHSLAAFDFDQDNQFTMTGTLVRVDYLNPHIDIWLDVAGEGDGPETWRIESGPPGVWRDRGIDKDRLEGEVGHSVTVEAAPARDGSHFGLLTEITFADGSSFTFR